VREGLARGEREAAAGQLHQLRGFAANLGAEGVMRSARALEEAIRRGEDPLQAEMATLDEQIRIVIDASAPWRQALGQPRGGVPAIAGAPLAHPGGKHS
jgi:HPt (histidine-containing phosphotransfer) domain-containing protein